MANNPDKAADDGKIGLPKVDNAMNKLPPTASGGGKGAKDDAKKTKASAKKKEEDKQAVLSRIRKRMDRCIQAEAENRKAALDDLQFKSGEAQWPADVAAQRNFDQRPCLTINKLPTFINQITNDIRQNRPAINVSPVGDKSDREVALMFSGLIRAIQRDCAADIAYDTATDNAVSNGFGYWRILTEYDDDDSFDQVLVIGRIRNPFTVYLDPDHQDPTGADCKYGFITEMVPRHEFDELWPDADKMPFTQAGIGEGYKNWVTQDEIRIAEYFEITNKPRELVALSNGHVGWEDALGEQAKTMLKDGTIEIQSRRTSRVPSVTWYKVTAKDILQEQPWLGRSVPIVKVIGNEIDVNGKVKLSGVIRNAKDAQRIYNYGKTTEIEVTMLAPKAPYIMEEGQVEGHEGQWKNANRANYPYLLYRAVNVQGKPAPPPQRQPVAAIPAGIVNMTQGAAQDMMATTGIRFDATMNERMIDESGRAIRELRRSGDLGSFHYVDNLARSLRRTGEILIDLIPKIYDTKRVLTILREDDSEEQVKLDPTMSRPYKEQRPDPTEQNPSPKTLRIFNPTFGKYGVTVTIGPSYATKRIESAESMMNFIRALPNTANLIADLVAKNMDWPGAQEMATRLAKAVPAQLLTPEQKDVPPQVQALLQQLDQQVKQLTQERMQLMQMLTDQQADRAQRQDKIDKEFEAKLLAVVQKAESSFATHVGSQLKDLAQGVKMLHESLSVPDETATAAE